jgi:hypothetical protein
MIKVGDKLISKMNRLEDAKMYLTEGKIYKVAYKVDDLYRQTLWIMCDDNLVRMFNMYDIPNYFLLYNEWLALEREKQIKSILDD